MLNENENKEHENNIENKNFKPKIIRNNIEKDEEKNINSNLSSGLTKVSNTIEQNNQEEDSIISPRIIKNFKNNEENTTNIIENKTVQNIFIDKDQLYETFLLFQNFMHSNQNNSSRTYMSSSTKQNKTESSLTINNEFDTYRNNNKIKEMGINKKISEINIEKNNNLIENNNKNEIKINNIDDIPIKPSNTNFEELLEKNLANEKYEESKNIIKKKIIKPHKEIKKKIISISKPSKNDKKYSYYTDLLDKDGHLDKKKLKLEQYKKHARCSSNYLIKETNNNKSKSTLNQINMTIETERNNLIINKMSKRHNKTSVLSDYKNYFYDENEIYNQTKNKIPEIETLTITESQNITKRNSLEFSPKKMKENLYIDKENNKNLLNFISNIENLKTPIKIDYVPNPIIENKENENNNKNNDDCNNNIIINQNSKFQNIKNNNDEVFVLKLNELEFEIKKSKEERLKIEKLKIEYEQLQLQLKNDINDFSKKKDEFEKFREIEIKKIEHDKKSYNLIQEKNNLLILSSKKDKETIEQLKKK